jgi:hypothetical protein
MVEAVFIGQPRLITDERGTWTSSIFRDRVAGPVQVSLHGLAGDKVEQRYHGGPGAAICVHFNDHYSFWKTQYNMNLQARCVGENVTLVDIAEDQVCVGDKVEFDASYARRTLEMSGLEAWWKDQARQNIEDQPSIGRLGQFNRSPIADHNRAMEPERPIEELKRERGGLIRDCSPGLARRRSTERDGDGTPPHKPLTLSNFH